MRNNNYLIGNKFAKGNKPNQTSFKKGFIPWNKGIKGTHFSPRTEFKKEHKGITWLPCGTIKIRTDKGKKQRQWIKINEPNIWIKYARFIWIKNNGLISKGYLIHHIDADTLNDNINNLAMITRKEHFKIHNIGEIGRIAKSRTMSERRIEKECGSLF